MEDTPELVELTDGALGGAFGRGLRFDRIDDIQELGVGLYVRYEGDLGRGVDAAGLPEQGFQR